MNLDDDYYTCDNCKKEFVMITEEEDKFLENERYDEILCFACRKKYRRK